MSDNPHIGMEELLHRAATAGSAEAFTALGDKFLSRAAAGLGSSRNEVVAAQLAFQLAGAASEGHLIADPANEFDELANAFLAKAAEPTEDGTDPWTCAELAFRLAAATGDKLAIGRLCGHLMQVGAALFPRGEEDAALRYIAEGFARLDRLADRDEETATGIVQIHAWLAHIDPEAAGVVYRVAADWQFDGEPA